MHTHEKERSPNRPADADPGLRLVQPCHPSRRCKSKPRHLPPVYCSLVRETPSPPAARACHALAGHDGAEAGATFSSSCAASRSRPRSQSSSRSWRRRLFSNRSSSASLWIWSLGSLTPLRILISNSLFSSQPFLPSRIVSRLAVLNSPITRRATALKFSSQLTAGPHLLCSPSPESAP
jgi:hypothetical protein